MQSRCARITKCRCSKICPIPRQRRRKRCTNSTVWCLRPTRISWTSNALVVTKSQQFSATLRPSSCASPARQCSVSPQVDGHALRKAGKIFTPGICPIWGHVFGNENFQKSQPESGFPPELFFQKSSFFSNISYRGVSWSDCLPRGVYI